MELSSDIVTTPPLDAASIVLLRDGEAGLEVFLMRRHGDSRVLANAYVFPGGKVDAADATLNPTHHLDQAPEALHAALHEPALPLATATSLYVAAVREVFEESGVLFAHTAHHTAPDLNEAQARLRDGMGFGALLADMGLRLHTQGMAPWSRWVTPRMPSMAMGKRFDTRFFVAAVPPGQRARHDAVETTASLWLPPRQALEGYWQHELPMAPPQVITLAHIARFATVDAVLAAARNSAPPTVAPEPFDVNGERVICYPGDPAHSVPTRALPGPTRVVFRNQRFEPEGGFDALFA